MSVVLSPLGVGQQFFGGSSAFTGNTPLTAGLLYVYAAGTTTPATTYTSSSGTTANTNPIVLDANGRVPYEIWWTPGSSYKFVLTDALGNSVSNGTWDNVIGINDLSVSSSNAASGISYTPPGTGAVATTVAEKLGQIVSVKDFGATGNGSTDDTAAIVLAAADNVSLYWPSGNYLVGPMVFANAQNWFCDGAVTITFNLTAGSAIQPICNFQGQTSLFGPFLFDHKANTGGYTNPSLYGGNVIMGSAIVIQGSYSLVDGIKIQNSWDNGLALVNVNSLGATTPGLPKYCNVADLQTTNCGCGTHTGASPGKLGAGIDIASATACNVTNCVDFNSYIGFILDIGAGANCNMSNCIAWYTQRDGSNPSNGSGYGFYIGGADSTFSNCTSYGSAYRAFWIDQPALNCQLTNCYAYFPQYDGFYIKSGAHALSNCRSNGASAVGAGTADAMLLDCSAGTINQLTIQNFGTFGTTHRYGINATGAYSIFAGVFGGSITGLTAATNYASYNIGTQWWNSANGLFFGINRTTPGVAWDVYGGGRYSASVANTSYAVNAFGDSGSNGTVFVEDFATPGKRMAMGYDPVNDVFVMQAIQAGVAEKPLMFNPSGGNVGLGAANLATTANNGFPQIPSVGGAPTGNPTALPGMVPIAFDSTDNKIWIHTGAGWKGVVVA
jgi:hypothetical protein